MFTCLCQNGFLDLSLSINSTTKSRFLYSEEKEEIHLRDWNDASIQSRQSAEKLNIVIGLTRTIPTFIVGQFSDCISSAPLRNRGDFTELFGGGFEVFDVFLGENIAVREVVGFFEALVPEPENVEAGFVAAL